MQGDICTINDMQNILIIEISIDSSLQNRLIYIRVQTLPARFAVKLEGASVNRNPKPDFLLAA